MTPQRLMLGLAKSKHFIAPSAPHAERQQISRYNPQTRRNEYYESEYSYMYWCDVFKTEKRPKMKDGKEVKEDGKPVLVEVYPNDPFVGYQDVISKIGFTPKNSATKHNESNEDAAKSTSDNTYNAHRNGVVNILDIYISRPTQDVISGLTASRNL